MSRRFAWAMVGAALTLWSCGISPREGIEETAISLNPDYAVTLVSGPPAAAPGASFGVTSTVCNTGGAVAPPAHLLLYASTDPTIDTHDRLIANRDLPGLQPQQCDTQVAIASSSETGTFYLGAIADPFDAVSEDSETNNSLAGGAIGIGFGPELLITSIAGPAAASGGFEVIVTVCNQGTQPSGGFDVIVYASSDTTITGIFEDPANPDPVVSWRSSFGLWPGQCDATPTSAFASVAAGAYYLGATVDESNAVAELVESNNHITGALTGLGDGPDLVVTALSGPPSANGVFDVTSTVCNQGTQPSSAFQVMLYASPDPTITGFVESPLPDLFLGTRFLGGLQPGQCDTGAATTFAPPGTGAYYLGAIVDEGEGIAELIESNNHTTGPLTGFGDAPDLVVASISGPPSASGAFDISATICNQGTQPSNATEVVFYASADTVITGNVENPFSADVALGAAFLGALQRGQCDTVSTRAAAPPGHGAFLLGAIVDEHDGVPELIEANNHTTGALTGFGDAPDLVVTALSGPPSASGTFDITSTVCNQGTRPSDSTQVQLYASIDTAITGNFETPASTDVLLGARSVAPLSPGQCDTGSTSVFFSSPQRAALYLGAIVDEFGGVAELIEANNRTTGPLTGFGDAPDLVVTAIAAPPTANAGFDITSTVCN